MSQSPAASPPRLPLPEFIALMAMLFAIVAFSIDAMLPAMPEIAAELSPGDPNRAQLILTSFMLGMGLGTFFSGPISDAFGRRSTIVGGVVLYIIGAAVAWAGPTLELVLLGRVIQGLGAAAPRIAGVAMVRDLYAGRQMARIMSFTMMVFMIVPAMAPMLGAGIIAVIGWRGIFLACILFIVLAMAWLLLRQPETLAPANRMPLRWAPLRASATEVLRNRAAQVSIGMQAMLFAALFGTLSQIQLLFDKTFGHGDTFPFWFAGIAVISGTASLMNAQLVMRLGMRRMVALALAAQLALSTLVAVVSLTGLLPAAAAFPVFLFWVTGVFFMTGFTIGNINAIAMEPLGHIAGMAASLIAALATVVGVALAVPVGLAFDGTVVPLSIAVALLAAAAALIQRALPRAR